MENSELAWLHDIIINQQFIVNAFEFTNCNNLFLDNIYMYPGLIVENFIKKQDAKLIKLSRIIL